MREDLKREKVEGVKRVYTLEGELFLSKMVEVDLAHEKEELKLGNSKADKLIVEADRRAKMLKRSTKRHVLEAFQWKKATADFVLLEAACAFYDALVARAEGEDYSLVAFIRYNIINLVAFILPASLSPVSFTFSFHFNLVEEESVGHIYIYIYMYEMLCVLFCLVSSRLVFSCLVLISS
jgi:hypothetical protein